MTIDIYVSVYLCYDSNYAIIKFYIMTFEIGNLINKTITFTLVVNGTMYNVEHCEYYVGRGGTQTCVISHNGGIEIAFGSPLHAIIVEYVIENKADITEQLHNKL